MGARKAGGASKVPLRKLAKRAGAAVLVLIAIDLVATAATVAVGAVMLKK